MSTVETFGSWLDRQAGRGDAIGEIATVWSHAQGQRPRRFAVKSVVSWVIEHASEFEANPPTLMQIMDAAAQEYRGGRPPYQPEPGPAAPPPAAPADLEASQPAEHYRRSTGREPPSMPDLAGMIASSVGEAVSWPKAQLDRIEAALQRLDQRFSAHEAALSPLRQLLTEIAEADEDDDGPDLAPGTNGLVSDLLAADGGPDEARAGRPYMPEQAYTPPALYGPYGQGARPGQPVAPDPSWAAIDQAVQPADLAEEDQPWRAGGEEPGE